MADIQTVNGPVDPILGLDKTESVPQKVSARDYSQMDESNWVDYVKERANKGDESAIDLLSEYYSGESSASTARNYESNQNAHIVDTLMEQYKRNGLNPYWLLDSGAGSSINYTASHNKYSSNYLNKHKADIAESKGAAQLAVSLVSSIVSAAILAYMVL